MNNNKKIGLGLERTVQWCVDNISNIYNTSEILSKFGIRVIDRLETEEDLLEHYPPETYAGEFGNAVLVGDETPFDYYIWTREFPDQIDPEHPINGEWLNIGQFPLEGPPGPAGKDAVGIRGQRGKSWFSGIGAPGSTTIPDAMTGDLYFQTSPEFGAVYRYNGTVWQYQGNLKGSPGSTGSPGKPGPAGPIVDLVGIVETVGGMLPVEEAVAQYGRQVAYLVGAENEPKAVWGAIGPDDNLEWARLGMFAAGTLVYEDGRPVETVDLSNYVPFVAGTSSAQVMIYDKSNNEFKNTSVSIDPSNYSIPMRSSNGTLKGKDPVDNTDLATKKYVDETVAGVVHNKYSHPFIITWREWVEDPDDMNGGYDQTFNNEPYYIKLTPGMDFYIDVAFESYITSSVCPYYKSGNKWYPIWEDNNTLNSLTAQKTYHFTVSQLDEDGSLVLRTEIIYKDEYGNPTTPGVVINGYDLTGQFSYGYSTINLKIGLDDDSYPDMYNTIFYTGNTPPTFGHDPIL